MMNKTEREERLRQILALRKKGKFHREIAEELGIKQSLVSALLWQEKKRRGAPNRQEQKIIALKEQGKLNREIAEYMGIPMGTVGTVVANEKRRRAL